LPPKGGCTGRCYCGASTVETRAAPLTVAFCHCVDCRRISGAPVAAFAAFGVGEVTVKTQADPVEINSGVNRWFCVACGSPLAATYAYLPGHIYIPLGLLDQAASLAPEQHSHADSALPWCHIVDDLPRFSGSGRDRLKSAT